MNENISEGAFDYAHDWQGDALIETESEAFQAGKVESLKKLLPYAHRDSNHEAASVVLELDGSEFDFRVGERFKVTVLVPAHRRVAHLHTHPDAEPHSLEDWQEFLQVNAVRQSHVIAPNATYSLHKPRGWENTASAVSNTEVADAYFKAYQAAQLEALRRGENAESLEVDEAAARNMAVRYGILCRVGIRREGRKAQ